MSRKEPMNASRPVSPSGYSGVRLPSKPVESRSISLHTERSSGSSGVRSNCNCSFTSRAS
eukprot:4287555-Amphidinium_carterae.2